MFGMSPWDQCLALGRVGMLLIILDGGNTGMNVSRSGKNPPSQSLIVNVKSHPTNFTLEKGA